MVYYNGTSISTVYDYPGVVVSDIQLLEDVLYFQASVSVEENHVYAVEDQTITEIALPPGELIHFNSIIVYDNALWVPFLTTDERYVLMRYDGSAFTEGLESPTRFYSRSLFNSLLTL